LKFETCWRATVLDTIEPEAVASRTSRDLSRLNIRPGTKIKGSNPAPANVVTNLALDPFGEISEFKFCAARVEILEVA
jgi:formate dehydrogenase major subunit